MATEACGETEIGGVVSAVHVGAIGNVDDLGDEVGFEGIGVVFGVVRDDFGGVGRGDWSH